MIKKYTGLVGFSFLLLFFAGGCASSYEELKAEKEKVRQERERLNEQHKRAREADYDLQKSTK